MHKPNTTIGAGVIAEIDRLLDNPPPIDTSLRHAAAFGSRLLTARDIINGRTTVTAITFTATNDDNHDDKDNKEQK